MLSPRDAIDRVDELQPGAALYLQRLLSLRGETVITAPSLPSLFHPMAFNEPAFFQAIEQRIEGSHIEFEGAFRAILNQLAELVPVPGPVLDQGQDKQLGTALLQLPIEDCRCNMCHCYIC